ncbi:response regulator [Planctomycetota bacterium]
MADKKILIADDEIHIVRVLVIKLKNNGYDVISAENGQQAFELAQKEKPDIIVTDYQMPIMTGLELIEKLRETDQTKDIPVIMLTARSFAIEKQQEQSLRISKCLSKPFSPKELLSTVESVLCDSAVNT